MGVLDLFSLKGRNALVTGSGQGLGSGIAIALAQAGANVTLHNYDQVQDCIVEQVASTGAGYIVRGGDLRDAAVGRVLVDDTVSSFGSIDILFNNAGTILRAPAEEHPEEYWQTVIDTNLNAVWNLCQYAGRMMIAKGRGKIINTASMMSFQGGFLIASYVASKGAVAQLTKALANEWAPLGINVNATAPGYMATDNTAPLRADPARSTSILGRIPAGRWGEPSDLGGAAVFLASEASNYIHGHVLAIDGGWLCR
ncbi:MAG TPA: SDR family oxidoreductase [Terracidiphilus sp.]|jgi:2-deoxy-D-gluconate 3-dehydrogenase|nr:SDR family oxidoreductase [Terracidiphilus sp.]